MPRPAAYEGFTSRALLDQISDKWTALILGALCHEPMRFNGLKRALDGISQTALTKALRRMERNGVVSRTVVATTPIAIEYAITPLGYTLEPIYKMLDQWTHEHLAEVERARTAFDAANGPT